MPTDRLEQGFLDHGYARTGGLVLGAVAGQLTLDVFQHQLDPLAAELLANLPAPEGRPFTGTRADLLAQLPEPDGQRADHSLTDDLLAELPDPLDDRSLVDGVDKITARLDRLRQPEPPAVDDGLGIDLW
ncbi:MAG: hypothetical protein HYX32_10380 [Actinobacteria bacterium]|nr:hypothetical protein [Actinomycetota bacterium]